MGYGFSCPMDFICPQRVFRNTRRNTQSDAFDQKRNEADVQARVKWEPEGYLQQYPRSRSILGLTSIDLLVARLECSLTHTHHHIHTLNWNCQWPHRLSHTIHCMGSHLNLYWRNWSLIMVGMGWMREFNSSALPMSRALNRVWSSCARHRGLERKWRVYMGSCCVRWNVVSGSSSRMV